MIRTKLLASSGIAAALLIGASWCHADNSPAKRKTAPGPVRRTTFGSGVAAVQQAPAAVEIGTAKPCAAETADMAGTHSQCTTSGRPFCRKLWDWLTYRPVTHTVVCGSVPCCTPPLYTYYLEFCPPPAGNRRGHHGRTSCAGTLASAEISVKAEEAEKASWFSTGWLGLFTGWDSSKDEDDADHKQVKHETTVRGGGKGKIQDAGEDCGRWRAVPSRPAGGGRK